MSLKRRESKTPEDFLEALEAVPQAKAAFQRSSASYREGLLALVSESRDESHRKQRISLVIRTLLQQGSG